MDYNAEIDCIGLYCPMPIAKTKEAMDGLNIGEILKVEADDPAAEEDIKAWAKRTGHKIIKFEKEDTIITFYIKKMK
jgi:TusA-related sulfurtransferase